MAGNTGQETKYDGRNNLVVFGVQIMCTLKVNSNHLECVEQNSVSQFESLGYLWSADYWRMPTMNGTGHHEFKIEQ